MLSQGIYAQQSELHNLRLKSDLEFQRIALSHEQKSLQDLRRSVENKTPNIGQGDESSDNSDLVEIFVCAVQIILSKVRKGFSCGHFCEPVFS